MSIQYLTKYRYFASFVGALVLIMLFGSLEVIRRAPLSMFVGITILALFLVLAILAIQKRKLEWLLFLYIFIQPMTKFPVYVYGRIRLSFVLLVFVVLGYIYLTYKTKSWFEFKVGKLVFPQFLFLCAVILSTLINILHISSFERVILHIANFAFVLVLLQIINSSKRLLRLLIVWCGSVSLLSIIGLVSSLYVRFHERGSSAFIQRAVDGITRIVSLTPDSNYFAVLFFIPLSLGLAVLLSKKTIFPKRYRIFFWIFVPLYIATVLLTYSRAGLLALGIVLLGFVFFERQFFRYTFWAKFGILVFSALVVSVLVQPDFLRNMIFRFPDSVISQGQKIQYGAALTFDKSHIAFRGNALGTISGVPSGETSEIIADDAIDVRGLYWDVALKMFKAHPIIGVGAGEYPYQFEKYLGRTYFASLPNTHDIFLETMAEFGIIGLLALLFLLARSLWVLRNLHHFSKGPAHSLVYALGVAYIASVFQYCFQPSFNSMNLWLLIGLFGVLEVMNQQQIQQFNHSLNSRSEEQ